MNHHVVIKAIKNKFPHIIIESYNGEFGTQELDDYFLKYNNRHARINQLKIPNHIELLWIPNNSVTLKTAHFDVSSDVSFKEFISILEDVFNE